MSIKEEKQKIIRQFEKLGIVCQKWDKPDLVTDISLDKMKGGYLYYYSDEQLINEAPKALEHIKRVYQ